MKDSDFVAKIESQLGHPEHYLPLFQTPPLIILAKLRVRLTNGLRGKGGLSSFSRF